MKRRTATLILLGAPCLLVMATLVMAARGGGADAEAAPHAADRDVRQARQLVEGILNHVAEDRGDAAFDDLKRHSTIPDEELDAMATETAMFRFQLAERWGPHIGLEFVEARQVGDSLMRLNYIEKRRNLPIRWTFDFYRAERTWTIVALDWEGDGNRLLDR